MREDRRVVAWSPPDPPLAAGELVVRGVRSADEAFVRSMWTEPVSVAMMLRREPTPAELTGIWRYIVDASFTRRFAYLVVEIEGEPVANITLTGTRPRVGEIGYVVDVQARGRGIAARAVDVVSRWAFEKLDISRLEARTYLDNPASHKVAERAGYAAEGVERRSVYVLGGPQDCIVWVRFAE
jgi:RimJ/RimL family protein N-acetyltransferase